MNWLAKVKSLLCRLFVLTEFCHRCGKTQPVIWWAEDWLWAEVTGNEGIWCPNCFDAEGRRKGISVRWRPDFEYRFDSQAGRCPGDSYKDAESGSIPEPANIGSIAAWRGEQDSLSQSTE